MNNKLIGFVLFVTGITFGSILTYGITSKKISEKYEKIAREDIDSVKRKFHERKTGRDITKKNEFKESDVDMSEVEIITHENGYMNYSDISKPDASDDTPQKPFVIPPDEFGEMEEYDQISLRYYSDHVLVDDANEMIEDIESIVGEESLDHFGEYEEDSVFVRNSRLKCDYEILYDQEEFFSDD